MNIMKNAAIEIVKKLQNAGHTAYWAGGCVRDLLMKRHPKDYDIATSAKPEEIEALFNKTIPIGKSFGVISAEQNGHHFEIATFRSDSCHSDGRRPNAVTFTHPAEDALRRDFTVNGLFFDPIYEEIHDFVGGQNDIQNKLIRFIGDPYERILEDHLRLLRALRFRNTLGFEYHNDTYKAIKRHSHLVNKVSRERVREELNRMIMHEQVDQAFADMQDTGILRHILPELCVDKNDKEVSILISAIKHASRDSSLAARWSIILHFGTLNEKYKDRRFDIFAIIMRRLRFSRQEKEHVMWILRKYPSMQTLMNLDLGRRRYLFLDSRFVDLLELLRVERLLNISKNPSLYEEMKEAYEATLQKFTSMPLPLLTGIDVMRIKSIKPSPQIGEILQKAIEYQLAGYIKTRNEALKWLKSL